MTKERKLAVEMWEIIRQAIENNKHLIHSDISEIKKKFCKEHHLEWVSGCWFCTYVRKSVLSRGRRKGCNACPIARFDDPLGIFFGCDKDSLYAIVLNHRNNFSIEERLEACDKIIKALEGERINENKRP